MRPTSVGNPCITRTCRSATSIGSAASAWCSRSNTSSTSGIVGLGVPRMSMTIRFASTNAAAIASDCSVFQASSALIVITTVPSSSVRSGGPSVRCTQVGTFSAGTTCVLGSPRAASIVSTAATIVVCVGSARTAFTAATRGVVQSPRPRANQGCANRTNDHTFAIAIVCATQGSGGSTTASAHENPGPAESIAQYRPSPQSSPAYEHVSTQAKVAAAGAFATGK